MKKKRFPKPTKIFKINNLVDLRLINNRTYIFVKKRRLMVCTFLLINIPKDIIEDYDEIKSIDEAAEILDKSLHRLPPYNYKISPEEEFRAHCSNIQVFFENGLNTNLLHTNIAFPLLKELVKQGFEPALKVFKEEIAIRFNEGTSNSRGFLYLQGYLNYLNEEERQVLKGYNEFIDSVARNPLLHVPEQLILDPNGDILFRVVILGSDDIGRSLLIRKFSDSSSQFFGHKIGFLSFAVKRVEIDNRVAKLLIWVPANNKNSLRTSTIKSPASITIYGVILSLGVIIMYDITNNNSLNRVSEWVQLIRENRGDAPIILVGNKADLKDKRVISIEEGLEVKERHNLLAFMEISLKTGKNVGAAFEAITRAVLKKN